MDYKVEELGPLKKKINVTVPANDVDTILDRVVAKYRSTVAIPGFRKGKAPVGMVEKQFARDIFPEATNFLVDNQVRGIIEELKLEPASDVEYDVTELVGRNKEFAYSFSVEVMPVFDLPDYQDFPLEQEEVNVTTDEIDDVIERIRHDMAQPSLIDAKRKPKDGDIVSLDFTGFDEEGKEIPGIKADNIQMPIGDGQALEDFEKIIKSVKVGEEGEGNVVFPADFPNPEFAGKNMLVKVKLHSLFERKLPEIDDEFAKKIGNFENVEMMRSAITSNFMQTRLQGAKNIAQKNLLDSLLKMVDYPLPESLVDRYETMAAAEAMQKLQQQGKIAENIEKLKADARPEAENYVRSYVFLHRAAKVENVSVEEQDIMQQLQRIAMSSGRKFEEVRDEYVNKNMIGALYERIMADKAMQAIYAKAKLTYVKPTKSNDEKAQDDAKDKNVKKTASKATKKSADNVEPTAEADKPEADKSVKKPKTSAKKS